MGDQKTAHETVPASSVDASLLADRKSRDLRRFEDRVLRAYLEGHAEESVPADELSARSLIPPSTAAKRSFASVAADFPKFSSDKCVACMECVIECPDAAMTGRVTTAAEVEEAVAHVADTAEKEAIRGRFVKTTKFWNVYERKGQVPGLFSIWIDPESCKGCGECVDVCGHGALAMVSKEEHPMNLEEASTQFLRERLPLTKKQYINERLITDLFLADESWVYRGGAGSCKGCGEITALKMALTATAARYEADMAIVAATGCNSVFSSTYPYNIFSVPWTNPLFENAPAMALGVRMRLNQQGKQKTRVWCVGGDGAMSDIGFQSLSRLLTSGEDIKILVMDTQVYSNTGGQASTATFLGQNAKMSAFGKSATGKSERRKELGLIAMMHPDIFVAQVSPAYYTHFLRATLDALEYPGPAVIIAYSPCNPEHGISDNASYAQSQKAVVSRAFPLFVHDPKKGTTIKERLDLRGNPSMNEAWHKDPKTGELCDFVWFAKSEERFRAVFDKEGNATETLLRSQEDRAKNWDLLQGLAGLK